ncbi:hypothetical protein ACFU98_32240 [Streptomyces sp. NPDC057575]|uniref:hypothetical protein n=1 Tax=unclassified Streptomyces TaxID=2593676 RepID=UPI00369C1FA6
MTTHLLDVSEADGEPVGRCYTKARRAPLVHGVIRDVNGGRGIRMPGGPYTLTQLAAIVGTFLVLLLTRPVWGGHGLLDVAVLLGLPFAAAFVLRQLHVDGRNPLAALLSVGVMMAGPRWGRLHGRPFRPARPTSGDTHITLTTPAPAPVLVPVPASGDGGEAGRPAATRPARPARTPARPDPGTAGSAPVTSCVQALLARRTAPASTKEQQ